MWRCFYSACAFFIFLMDVLQEIFRHVYFRRKENVSRHPSHEWRQMMERGLLSTALLLGNQNWTSLKFLQTLQSSGKKKSSVSFGSGATFSNLPRVRETSSRVTQGGGGRAGLLFHPFPLLEFGKMSLLSTCAPPPPPTSPKVCSPPPLSTKPRPVLRGTTTSSKPHVFTLSLPRKRERH